MATYLIESEIALTRQEGDNCDIQFKDVPIELNLTGASAKFEVKRKLKTDTPIITKTVGSGITISGQDITISLLPVDTKGNSGRWRWELQITLADLSIITIGRGCLNITPELID
jgi:hypothetical protein